MEKERLMMLLNKKYYSKSELLSALPLGVSHDEIWNEIKAQRMEQRTLLPMQNPDGKNYWYVLTEEMINASESIIEDLSSLGQKITFSGSVISIEEAFFTGYLEGSQMSVQEAMEFLQSGEAAKDGEELILENSRAAAIYAAEHISDCMSMQYICKLAYILTKELDTQTDSLRTTDTVEILSMDNELYHLIPAADLEGQMNTFIEYVNDTAIHPLIKAAVAQAWILAVRPFSEGNERLARLLSNIILFQSGYTLFCSISISSVIAKSSYSYFKAIANLLREENEGDMTYFLEYYLALLSTTVKNLKKAGVKKVSTLPHRLSKPKKSFILQPLSFYTNHPQESIRICAAVLLKWKEKEAKVITTKELVKATKLDAKTIYRVLCFFEDKTIIKCVSRSTSGNLYVFCSEADEIRIDVPEEYIIKIKQKAKTSNTQAIANILISYLKQGKLRFSKNEVIRDTSLVDTVVVNTLQRYKSAKLLKTEKDEGNTKCYSFCLDET